MLVRFIEMYSFKFLFVSLSCIITTNSQFQKVHSEALTDKLISTKEMVNSTTPSYELQEYSNSTDIKWSEWSTWSKCRKCVQKRMKICLQPSCDFTKVYQERQCKKKKCMRKKKRRKDDFHVVLREKVR